MSSFAEFEKNFPEIGPEARPAFRICAHLSTATAHPYLFTEQYEALFQLFAPVLKKRCAAVRMWDRPGGSARRGHKIKPEDWRPFERLKSVHSDPETGNFFGFYFVDRDDEKMEGRGPCSFRFFSGLSVRLDACVPLEAFETGEIDVRAIIDALQKIPYHSFSAGYGLSLSDRFKNGAEMELRAELLPVALRYPAVDLCHMENRTRVPQDEKDAGGYWIGDVNWITGVGEPFLSALGGPAVLMRDVPAGIEASSGRYGVVFRIGDRPITGEAGVDDATLGLYNQLGKLLMPRDHPSAARPRPPVFGTLKEAESLAWTRRFYDS